MVGGVARDIDNDVDLLLTHVPRDRQIVHGPHVDEAIEGALDTRSHGASVILAIGDGRHFEACSIVSFEQPGKGIGHGVIAKITR